MIESVWSGRYYEAEKLRKDLINIQKDFIHKEQLFRRVRRSSEHKRLEAERNALLHEFERDLARKTKETEEKFQMLQEQAALQHNKTVCSIY